MSKKTTNIMRMLLPLIFFLVSISGSNAETTATVSISPNNVKIGDKLSLMITVSYTGGTSTVTPKVEVSPLSSREDDSSTWTLLSKPTVQKETEHNLTKETHQYFISAYALGKLDLPDVSLTYSINDSETTTVVLPKQSVTIASTLLPDDMKMQPIKSPFVIPLPKWIYVAIAIIAALILGMVIFFVIRFAQKKIVPIIAPPLTLEQWANKELDKIETEKLIESRLFKEYFSRMSETLRLYTGKKFMVSAMDMTTDELISHLKSDNVDSQLIDLLSAPLNSADLVKFAKYEPDRPFCNRAINNARNFISTSSAILQESRATESMERS